MSYQGRRRVQRSTSGVVERASSPGRSPLTSGLVQRKAATGSAVQLLQDPVQKSPAEGGADAAAAPPPGASGGNQGAAVDAKAAQIAATMRARNAAAATAATEAADAGAGADAGASAVQRRAVQFEGAGGLDTDAVHAAAERGTASGGAALPHMAAIQASFGAQHDLAGVKAHVGGNAADACDEMGASAFATGDDVAFASSPNLHTAAHEAAHVIQQRQGVQLYGGVGQAGDQYELNADAVADRVVAGKSAADLLGAPASEGGAGDVQQQAVQRDVQPGTAGTVAPAGGPTGGGATTPATLDHYKIELKAWIPHYEVVDPEEPIRTSDWLDTVAALQPPGAVASLRYDYHSRYRGDNHADYDGSARAKATLEFDFDGTNIIGAAITTPSLAFESHRHYWYRAYVETLYGLGPDIELDSGDSLETGPAGGGCSARASGTTGHMSIAAPNLLTIFPAPDINSDMDITVGAGNMALAWNTDMFPSHGFRLWKNGSVLLTEIVNNASGVAADGPIGAANLGARLTMQVNAGNASVRT